MKLTPHAILAAAAIAVAIPSSAVAQDTMNSTDSMAVADDEDEDFPWGLLGLLGLAGLIPRKNHNDVHVNRNDHVNR